MELQRPVGLWIADSFCTYQPLIMQQRIKMRHSGCGQFSNRAAGSVQIRRTPTDTSLEKNTSCNATALIKIAFGSRILTVFCDISLIDHITLTAVILLVINSTYTFRLVLLNWGMAIG